MIKNIIFDFGDVFINLDKQATYRELAKLGLHEVDESMLEQYYAYETGKITTEAFVGHFHKTYGFSKEDLVRAWNAILLDFPKHRLQFLKELSAGAEYRLFLLSNTNELHIDWIKNDWGMELYEEFKSCFEQFYLSHEIHFRKPNSDIYQFVLAENNLLAEETFFIDDTLENTEAAEQLGIRSWNIDPEKEDVVNLAEKLGI